MQMRYDMKKWGLTISLTKREIEILARARRIEALLSQNLGEERAKELIAEKIGEQELLDAVG